MIDRLAKGHWGLRLAFAVLAGLTTALGFQPYGWWPLTVVGVAGLTVVVRAAAAVRGAAGLGFGYGLGLLLLGVGWMQVIFVQAMVALVVAEAIFFALLAVGIRLAGRSRWWPALAALCWTAVEFSFSRFPFDGFGWLRLGYAMVDSPLAGLLPLVGVAGLGFATAAIAQLPVWVALRRSRRSALVAGAAALGLALLAVAGALVPPGPASGQAQVGWVQGGAPGGGVFGLGPVRTITANQAAETGRLVARVRSGELPAPDFIVWPENGTDLDPYRDAATRHLVQSAAEQAGVPIFLGTILDGPGPDERQTASLWWDPHSGEQGRYVKRGIVPFGEWIPLRPLLLPVIPELAYVGAQSVAGTAPGVLPVTLGDGRELPVGVLVCYDLAFDAFVYDTVRHGGQILVVQSSNAMYQGTGQIDQQFAITRARAMELRREILVVTTSGVSGLIQPDGKVAFQVPDYTSASGVVTLPRRSGVTPATGLAPLLEAALSLAAVVGVAAVVGYGRIGPRTTSRQGQHGRLRSSA